MSSSDKLDRVDWSFGGVDPDEMPTCCIWEYARESRSIREAAEDYRKIVAQYGPGRIPVDVDDNGNASLQTKNECLKHLIKERAPFPSILDGDEDGDCFPAPWGNLSIDRRVDVVSTMEYRSPPITEVRDPAAIMVHRLFLTGIEGKLHPNRPCPFGAVVVKLAINLRDKGNKECLDAFESLLKEWRLRERFPEPPYTKGGHKKIDCEKKLLYLGAARLYKRYTSGEIRQRFPALFGKWTRSQICHAVRTAEDNFHKLLPFLSHRERPLFLVNASPTVTKMRHHPSKG